MTSNRRKDHEISVLALHMIQNCMVYINMLMVQKMLRGHVGIYHETFQSLAYFFLPNEVLISLACFRWSSSRDRIVFNKLFNSSFLALGISFLSHRSSAC